MFFSNRLGLLRLTCKGQIKLLLKRLRITRKSIKHLSTQNGCSGNINTHKLAQITQEYLSNRLFYLSFRKSLLFQQF